MIKGMIFKKWFQNQNIYDKSMFKLNMHVFYYLLTVTLGDVYVTGSQQLLGICKQHAYQL